MTQTLDGAATTAAPSPTQHVDVGYVIGEAYEIQVRGHRFRVDQPTSHGGTDAAPTPTELFIASLAACVAFYAGRYLTRHGFDRDGLEVSTEFEMAADRPARVAAVRLAVNPPAGFPVDRVPALAAAASHCTVHNSITHRPDITVTVG